MQALFPLVIAALIACGLYLMMRHNLLRFIFGFILLGNGVNLLIFTIGRLHRGGAPIIPEKAESITLTEIANPVPQALILTAIVIGFGFTAFALVLLYRSFQSLESLDTEQLEQPLHANQPHEQQVAEVLP